MDSKREYTFKILVIGDPKTGKTSIVKKYMGNFFTDRYKATVGVDFGLKIVHYNETTEVKLQFWDIMGQDQTKKISRVYRAGAVGCLIVYDITNRRSFESANIWKKEIESSVQLGNGKNIPCILLGNKCDLEREPNPAMIKKYAIENSYSGFFETSAKENIGIKDAAMFLIKEILKDQKIKKERSETMSVVQLKFSNNEKKTRPCC